MGILSGSGLGRTQVLRAWHARLLLSAVQVDKEDVLICAIAGSGLLEVTGAGAAHSCQVWERQSRVSRRLHGVCVLPVLPPPGLSLPTLGNLSCLFWPS